MKSAFCPIKPKAYSRPSRYFAAQRVATLVEPVARAKPARPLTRRRRVGASLSLRRGRGRRAGDVLCHILEAAAEPHVAYADEHDRQYERRHAEPGEERGT